MENQGRYTTSKTICFTRAVEFISNNEQVCQEEINDDSFQLVEKVTQLKSIGAITHVFIFKSNYG